MHIHRVPIFCLKDRHVANIDTDGRGKVVQDSSSGHSVTLPVWSIGDVNSGLQANVTGYCPE